MSALSNSYLKKHYMYEHFLKIQLVGNFAYHLEKSNQNNYFISIDIFIIFNNYKNTRTLLFCHLNYSKIK